MDLWTILIVVLIIGFIAGLLRFVLWGLFGVAKLFILIIKAIAFVCVGLWIRLFKQE